tara:strand:+ start:135 stop:941 length:807 start_codon:yes stop_codon:yes gene_type:complete
MVEPEYLSLGAGVQSSCLALMAARGQLEPMPSAAVFADTGAEPKKVYEYLKWLTDELPFPVHVVQHKRGLTANMEDAIKNGVRMAQPPLFTKNPDGSDGQIPRVCTVEFKVSVLRKRIRTLLGMKPRQRHNGEHCIQWIGISLDEIQRMRESTVPYITNRFPLVEKRMRRGDCLEWMKKHGYPEPPRSACVYCPYHSDHEWRRIKQHDPDGWEEALRVDELVRDGWKNMNSKMYLHSARIPLKDVDFSTDVDRGQLTMLDECTGMCGN